MKISLTDLPLQPITSHDLKPTVCGQSVVFTDLTTEMDRNRYGPKSNQHQFSPHNTVAGPGEGPGGSGSPLVLAQTEARRAEKIKFETAPPLLSQGLDDPPPLLIWIRHFNIQSSLRDN